MPQCGLAPGFIGIVAHHLAKQFDDVRDVQMRVGALPAFPTNKLKYNLTWSVDGLINEYCHPCEAIHGGEFISGPAAGRSGAFQPGRHRVRGLQHLGRPGYPVRDLVGQGASNLDYKTVRYPGHRDLMKFLLEDLALAGDQEQLKDIMRKSMPATMQDVVLVFVTVSGMKNGQLLQEVFARKIFAERGEKPLSAIQITTAAGICTAVDLFREGKLPQKGFVRQEDVALPDFLANRFGKAYEQTARCRASPKLSLPR
jgi:saccharopine dehydrogenase-like NADP-dependent oxidoreductase